MRYLVKGRVTSGQEKELLRAVNDGTLGRGSIAGDEYLRDMAQARIGDDGEVHWVEVCFCAIPLAGADCQCRVLSRLVRVEWKQALSSSVRATRERHLARAIGKVCHLTLGRQDGCVTPIGCCA